MTTPGTQLSFDVRPWCAGHPWRYRRGLGWLHRAGHAARLLTPQDPPGLRAVILLDTKPEDTGEWPGNG